MSLLHLLVSIGQAFAERRRREHAYRDLMALDDHALADIGVARPQIRFLLEGGDVDNDVAAPIMEGASFWSAQRRLIGPSE